ncbi:TAXI family TRAP transporter solute-binding subunit [Salinicoccus sp. ID82-1]|uniref:TAXI family TRAP transporter solute-binding subunit n=1 Tax=Salinicoccus cyprini TaxID=2493691 RepID=A0A558AST0_9STAP|nr:TAXI family TRAP transporter solute-binding subunit [Salinicoccus cyprini]MCG1009807.1 TAXI family TRAP transporter solute-binding subunit [Salinicoccus sp. ID82-1]TVT27325.1 TAXI family TRAP transporter solute-binding subunit [Salinicoccus cyprini]
MKKSVASILLIVTMMVLSSCNFEKKEVYNIATASTGGTYYPIGVGMGQLWTEQYKEQNIKFNGQSSAGSVENIDLLKNGEADMAILQNLISTQASEGSGIYEGDAYGDLRAIGMIWPNVEHFVLMTSEVETGNISDIEGNSFSVGPQASGTEQSTLTIMESLGLDKNSIRPEYLGYDDTISSMRDGRLEGGSLPAGTPVSAITDMFASGLDAEILSITDEQLEAVNSIVDAWYKYTIEEGTYPRQTEDIETIAQPNILVTSTAMDEEMVYNLTRILFENREFMIGVHNSAREMQIETALEGLNTPLHAGAYRYFKEQGLEIDEKLIPEEIQEGGAQNE